MSEQINKVLASTSQAFSTAEQKQARDNISAQAKITFTYSGSTITGIDGSPVGGGLGEVYAGNCISGSGTSGSPIGISSSVSLYKGNPYYNETYLSAGNVIVSGKYNASMTVYKDQSSHTIVSPTGIYNIHTAEGIGGGYTRSIYGEVFDLQYNGGSYALKYISADDSGIHCESNGNTSRISKYGFGSAIFTDDTGTTWEVVDAASIRRWNSGRESARISGTGFSPVSALSNKQNNNNWVTREIGDGTSSITSYAFKAVPSVAGHFCLNGAGGWLPIQPSAYSLNMFNVTDENDYTWEHVDAYPITDYNWRMDFIAYGTGTGRVYIVLNSTAGNTAYLETGESASIFYDSNESAWIGIIGNHNLM